MYLYHGIDEESLSYNSGPATIYSTGRGSTSKTRGRERERDARMSHDMCRDMCQMRSLFSWVTLSCLKWEHGGAGRSLVPTVSVRPGKPGDVAVRSSKRSFGRGLRSALEAPRHEPSVSPR